MGGQIAVLIDGAKDMRSASIFYKGNCVAYLARLGTNQDNEFLSSRGGFDLPELTDEAQENIREALGEFWNMKRGHHENIDMDDSLIEASFTTAPRFGM